MKKLLSFLMVLCVLFAFIACDNGNGGSDNGNEEITTVNKEKEALSSSFSDCTTPVEPPTVIVFSDGKWTIKDFIPTETEGLSTVRTIKATGVNGERTFTSGYGKTTADLAILEKDNPEFLAALESASDEEKTEMLKDEIGDTAFCIWDGLSVTIIEDFSEEDLAAMESGMDFSTLPDYAVVKTNANNTKYVITIEVDDLKEELYISKD